MIPAPTSLNNRLVNATPNVPNDSGAIAIVERIVVALRRAGLAAGGEAVVERDHMAGGAVEWWLLEGSAESRVWVQYLSDRRLRPAATRVMRASNVLPNSAVAPRDGVYLVAPVPVAPATYAYPVGAGAELFAAMLLRGLGVGGAPRQDWLWLLPLCARLGAALRDVHEVSRGTHTRPALPRANDVTRRVRGLIGAGLTTDAASVRDTLAEFPRLRAALIASVRRFYRDPDPATLHGRYAPGQILVDARPESAALPEVHVAGWLEAASGPPAYDAGYFIGELMELAVFAAGMRHAAAEHGLRMAAREFYNAYVSRSAATLPEGFAEHAAEFAALKIVEHVARFVRYFGDPGPEVARLLRAADSLLCPDQGPRRMVGG